SPLEPEKRQELLKQMFAEIGEGCFIEPPLRANWSGKFVHLGNNVYANFNLTLVDDTEILIGDNTLLGPNVTIAVAGHPLDAKLRSRGWQYNLPVTIGKDCWLGAGVIVMPGVTIGDGTVIGAGSVVTKDIPSGVLAYGVPCRVIRELGVHDREYYFRDRKIPEALKQRFGL
ncbi:MAG: sugar O-acetyltransferase, partial [Solobacterium sp.]|nr:sugar O-acetyltransferase [Solobacterium sp.]